MTNRFSLNNITPSSTSTQYPLWYFYSFMTKASPNGPGWVSVGEGNGTSGGMGTTGLFTSETSLASTSSWYVLRSPDSKMYVLCSRNSSYAYYANFALTTELPTGGSATANPTFTTSKTLIFGATNFVNSTAYRYNISMMADDAYPYGFYMFVMNVNLISTGTAPSSYDGLWLIPMDGYDASDGYPYVFARTSGLNAGISAITDTTYGTKSFNFDGSIKAVTPPLTLYNYTTMVGIRSTGPMYNQVFAIPLMFANTLYYKGITYKYGWVPTKMQAGRTLNNKQQIVVGDIVIPWDGYTTPILNAN